MQLLQRLRPEKKSPELLSSESDDEENVPIASLRKQLQASEKSTYLSERLN